MSEYIPALRFDALTPIYDLVMRWLMQEDRIKRVLVEVADIQPGHRVLDLGCGTATLTVMIKQAHPQAVVTGLDGDPKVLKMGRAKAEKAGVELNFDQGMAYDLPYPDACFERVLSSLMFHHLTTQNKQQSLQEIYRILKQDGRLGILDFGPPSGVWSHLVSPLTARLEEVGDHHRGLIPVMMRRAGFTDVAITHQFGTVFGTLNVYVGRRSANPPGILSLA